MGTNSQQEVNFPCPRYGQSGHDWITCPDCREAEAQIDAEYNEERKQSKEQAEQLMGSDILSVTVQVLAMEAGHVRLDITLLDDESEGVMPHPPHLPADTATDTIFEAWIPEWVRTWEHLRAYPEALVGFVLARMHRDNLPFEEVLRHFNMMAEQNASIEFRIVKEQAKKDGMD
jgi:hypothetical protein